MADEAESRALTPLGEGLSGGESARGESPGGGSHLAAAGTGAQGRMREIEAMMAQGSFGPYWRGPNAEAIQAEYRALLEGGETANPEADWSAAGLDLRLAKATVAHIERDMGEDWEFLAESFDARPEAFHAVVAMEFARPAPYAEPVSPEGVQNFASTPEGAELARMWGTMAPEKIGRVRARMERMLAYMDEDTAADASEWFNALPSGDAKAIITALAG